MFDLFEHGNTHVAINGFSELTTIRSNVRNQLVKIKYLASIIQWTNHYMSWYEYLNFIKCSLGNLGLTGIYKYIDIELGPITRYNRFVQAPFLRKAVSLSLYITAREYLSLSMHAYLHANLRLYVFLLPLFFFLCPTVWLSFLQVSACQRPGSGPAPDSSRLNTCPSGIPAAKKPRTDWLPRRYS